VINLPIITKNIEYNLIFITFRVYWMFRWVQQPQQEIRRISRGMIITLTVIQEWTKSVILNTWVRKGQTRVRI